jgi:hypothetical protein
MSAVSATISGMNILLFELNRTVRKDKCGRPNYRPAAATRSEGGRKHRAPVKLIGELDQRFFDIAETRVRLRKVGGHSPFRPSIYVPATVWAVVALPLESQVSRAGHL